MLKNSIPTVDDVIFSIDEIAIEVPLNVKDVTIKGTLYQRRGIIVDSVNRSEKDPEKYVTLKGRVENTLQGLEIDFPKVLDTPDKVFNRFYSSEQSVNKAITELAKSEIERVNDIAEALLNHITTLQDIVSIHSK